MQDVPLSPEYLTDIQFTTTMRGYDQSVVDAFIDAAIANLQAGRPAMADLTPQFPIVMRGYAVNEINALLDKLNGTPITTSPDHSAVVKPKGLLSRLFGN